MELKPGYKQTEVGAVPQEWNVVAFSDLFDFRNGVNASKESYGRGIPFVNVLEIITKGHLKVSDVPGKISLTNGAIDLYTVRRGDLLFNRTSETQEEVGLAAVYLDDEPMVFGGFVIRGRPTDANIDATFSGYAFRSPAIRAQIIARGQGAIRANVGQGDLRTVLAALPPLPEQCAIAGALSDVDDLIESLEQLLSKKREIKHGAMQGLLTGKSRLVGFRGDWEVHALGELGECFAGGTPSTLRPEYWGGEIYWIPSGRVQNCILDCPSENEARITSRGLAESAAKPIRARSVLIAITGATCANVASLEFAASANQSVVALEPNDSVSYRFLYYSMQMKRDSILSLQSGSAQGGVNLKALKSIPLNVPSLPEQTAIAAILSDMDAEIALLETRLDKTRRLKLGMMQELLTGRIRLV